MITKERFDTGAGTGAAPEFMRMPKRGGDPLFGLTRPFLYGLINAGMIRSVSIRRPGAATGVRLIDVASVRTFIERQAKAAGQ